LEILRKILNVYVLTALFIVSGFAIWRYWPVKIHVSKLERVEAKVDVYDKMQCKRFTLTAAAFEDYFAASQHLFPMELNNFSVGTCYYKADIEGIEYRIWDSGLAEVRDEGKIDFYTVRSNTAPASED
jgi:hypothetical protein